MTLYKLFNLALWLAGITHLCLLGASCQLPYRLNWKDDLKKITPFNRKLMWTYYYFTTMTIIAFGIMTLLYHDELLIGSRDALALAVFIGVYWLARISYDVFYFSHADWPKGQRFVIGHALLMFAFIALTLTYFSLVAWHVFS